MPGFDLRTEDRVAALAGLCASGSFGRGEEEDQAFLQSVSKKVRRWRELLLGSLRRVSRRFAAFLSPKKGLSTTDRPIISITRETTQEVFWDLQVEGTHNYVTVDGAVHHNCGKSYAIMWEIMIRAAQQPVSKFGTRRSKVIFVRNTRQMLVDSVLPIMREVFPHPIGTWLVTDSTYQIRMGNIECDILLRPLEDAADIKRVLSINATFCVLDEWREIDVKIINDIAGRAGRFPAKEDEGCAFVGIFGASNPPVEDGDWHEMLEVKQPEGWETFKFPSARSPEATWKRFLDDGYYERLIAGAPNDDYIRVMIDGRYGRSLAGRPVYEASFNRDFHVAKEPLAHVRDQQYPIVVGFDFGRTPAAVFGQRDSRGRVLILDSIYKENIGLERFVIDHVKPLLASRFPGMPVRGCGDPAGAAKAQINEQTCFDILRLQGVPSQPASTNDPDLRIECVERLLSRQTDGQAYFLIDPRCKHLITGLNGGYKYKRKTDGTYEAKPDKNEFSHDNDALQYLCDGIDGPGGYVAPKRREVKKANYLYI